MRAYIPVRKADAILLVLHSASAVVSRRPLFSVGLGKSGGHTAAYDAEGNEGRENKGRRTEDRQAECRGAAAVALIGSGPRSGAKRASVAERSDGQRKQHEQRGALRK